MFLTPLLCVLAHGEGRPYCMYLSKGWPHIEKLFAVEQCRYHVASDFSKNRYTEKKVHFVHLAVVQRP